MAKQKYDSKTAKLVGMFLVAAAAVALYAGCSSPGRLPPNDRAQTPGVYDDSSYNDSSYNGGHSSSFFNSTKSRSYSSGISSGSRGGIGSSSGSSS